MRHNDVPWTLPHPVMLIGRTLSIITMLLHSLCTCWLLPVSIRLLYTMCTFSHSLGTGHVRTAGTSLACSSARRSHSYLIWPGEGPDQNIVHSNNTNIKMLAPVTIDGVPAPSPRVLSCHMCVSWRRQNCNTRNVSADFRNRVVSAVGGEDRAGCRLSSLMGSRDLGQQRCYLLTVEKWSTI